QTMQTENIRMAGKKIGRFVILSFIISINQQIMAETLQDAVMRTVNYNPDIRNAAKIRSVDNEGVWQARAGYFPTVDLNAGYSRERSTNFNSGFTSITLWRTDFGVNARQMLFDGFATSNEVRRNKAKTNADAFRVWGVTEDVALKAVQAYLDVLR